jgi:co-chaperonin GroES (HSP10)
MQTTANRVIIEPIFESNEYIDLLPQDSRWKNGRLSICGKVVAKGPGFRIKRTRRSPDVEIGQYVWHSDSSGEFIKEGKYKVIRENDIMFLADEFVPVEWVGAEEKYDE